MASGASKWANLNLQTIFGALLCVKNPRFSVGKFWGMIALFRLNIFPHILLASVRPPSSPEEEEAAQNHLDRVEADLRKRLRCMDENGGMNRRDEDKRRKRN